MDDRQSSRTRQILQQTLQRLVAALSPVVRATPPAAAVTELPGDGDVRKRLGKQSFSDSLYAELLLELPMHRQRLFQAHLTGDMESLRRATHQLLGAVVYCDAAELEEALRELRLALKTGEQHGIDVCHEHAINVLDSTLRYSSVRGQSAAGHTGI
jgi:HPt (histidine-containing phosphotransfer) domain-containing protein